MFWHTFMYTWAIILKKNDYGKEEVYNLCGCVERL